MSGQAKDKHLDETKRIMERLVKTPPDPSHKKPKPGDNLPKPTRKVPRRSEPD